MRRNDNMNRITKKGLAILLVAAMLFTILPVSALADSDATIYVGGVQLSKDKPYVPSKAADAESDPAAQATQPESGGYAYWNAATSTLTLHNYTYSGVGYLFNTADSITGYAVIWGSSDYTVQLEGENSITNTGTGLYCGIANNVSSYSGCNVTIDGTGSLAISACYGIYMIYSSKLLTINGGSITISPNYNHSAFYGISTYNCSVSIGGDANLSVLAGNFTGTSKGISMNGNMSQTLTIAGDAVLNLDMGNVAKSSEYASGIYCNTDGGISISGNANVTITGGDNSKGPAYGIYAGYSPFTVTGDAQLSVKGGTSDTSDSVGIMCDGNSNIASSISISDIT